MSIWSRPTNHFTRSRNCAGHAALRQYTLGPSISVAPPQSGHAVGASISFAPLGRSATTTSTTCGMISPAFSTITVSPTRMSLRRISSMLCRVACCTVVPPTNTGFMVARGVSVPPLPTCHSTCSSVVGLRSAGYLNATAQRGALLVLPSRSRKSSRSTFTTKPSTPKSSEARSAANASMAATACSTVSQRCERGLTGNPSARHACSNSQ